MSRQYVTAAHAQTYYAERAAEYASRGLPKIASDYRWLASEAHDIAARIDRAGRDSQETTR
jgi:hypothetical protein